MTKMFVFLFTLTISAIAAMWFIENDGSIIVEWMGYQIQTSVAFTALAGVVVFVILTTIIQMLLWLKNAPGSYKRSNREKKRDQGLNALTSGFGAIAAGDTKQARKLTKQAIECLGNLPITKLLEAQTAQLEGNVEEAKEHYQIMLEHKETKIIAIKALLLQAEQDGDLKKAIHLAEKAVELQPDSDWANNVLIRLYKITKRWEAAETILHIAAKLKVITADDAKRDLAIIALAQCNEYSEAGKDMEALKSAEKAYKALPGFAPVATTYARLLLKSDKKRKAVKVLEACWKIEPHPQIAALYTEMFSNESPEKLVKHAEKLLALMPNNIDSHIIVARTAILADIPSKARNHLKIALSIRENRTICKLMAEVEELEESSKDVVNQWRQRAETSNSDPIWSCTKCGAINKKWHTNCDNCQSFDSLKWSDNKDKMKVIRPKAMLSDAA